MTSQTTPAAHRVFYHILANNLIAGITNNFVWFALTFWVFIETQSVLATSWIAGIFALASMAGGFIFGPIVDHERKWTAMLHSSLLSLMCYIIGALIYFLAPADSWSDITSPILWGMIGVLMVGVVANNLRVIALSTTVTMLFSEDRDKANGLVGATQGLSFAVTSVLSGITIGWFGMTTAIVGAVCATLIVILTLFFIHINEPEIVHIEARKRIDFKGTYLLVLAIPGLIGLIIFNTFNNFLGGVFMALMDAYGLSLVSVEVWGTMWGVLSLAMIAGSVYVSRFGVGNKPLRRIMVLNICMWATCIIFPLQASIYLLAMGMFTWLLLMPMVEAAEQTILQTVVPYERQGRVFGFAQSIESFASPITTLFIGPVAQFMFIPFMTTGAGVTLIGTWFGAGPDRGIALVFIAAGCVGLLATAYAWRSRSYRLLATHYTATE